MTTGCTGYSAGISLSSQRKREKIAHHEVCPCRRLTQPKFCVGGFFIFVWHDVQDKIFQDPLDLGDIKVSIFEF